VKTAFRQNTVSIIHEDLTYGSYLAHVFEETSHELGVEVKYKWFFETSDKNLDLLLKDIVDELQSKKDAGVIFLATHAPEGAKLVRLMKDAGIQNPVITPDDFSIRDFLEGFNQYPKERINPGYYADGIYVASALIFDTANEKAQQFEKAYKAKYKAEPDWHAACAYDAAMIILEAVKNTGVEGKQNTIKDDREKIKDYLALRLTNIEDAVEGVTGFIYFDKKGDPPKPVSIGVYKKKNIISALTQLQAIRNLNEIPDLEKAIEEELVLSIGGKYMYKTSVVYAGIEVNEISEFEIGDLTYMLDFHLWFRYQGEIDVQNIEFLNTVEPIQLGEPIDKKVSNHLTYSLYHVKGRFKMDFLSRRYGLEQHVLGVSFRHRDLTRNNLIYVIDTLGMGLTGEKSLAEKMSEAKVLSPAFGWMIKQSWFFQDIAAKKTLGSPEYLNLQGGIVECSGFNLGILIEKNEFTRRGIIPKEFVNYLLVLSIIIILLLVFAGEYRSFKLFSKSIWIFQTIFAFLLLLSSEVVLVNWLLDKIDTYYLKFIILSFDVLWWGVPALLLDLAIERFLWTPLEKRTDCTIPTLLRRFVSFIIYVLAFFAIVAFVFNQRLTGLLATSGVAAMIIGLAIRINISNIFSGIAINLGRPFRIGDWIKIGDIEEGEVVDITWRATELKTRDDSILSIPNSTASESTIYNYHYPDDLYKLSFTVHVDPIHPPERVQKILLDAVLSAEGVSKEPPPYIRFRGMSDWSVDYAVDFHVRDYEKKEDYDEAVWKRVWTHLNGAGILPAIQRQEIHMFRGIKARGEQETKPPAILQKVDIFQPLSDEAKSYLSKQMHPHHFSSGETIVQRGFKNFNKLSLLILSVVVVGAMFSCDMAQQSLTPGTPSIIKIGVIVPQNRFVDTQYGLQLALTELNAQGGINGIPLKLVLKDNRADPDLSAQITEELITRDGVVAILGGLFSTNTVRMAPVAQLHGIPMMAIGATNPAVTEAGDKVFLAAFADTFQGKVMAQFATRELNADTAAILTQAEDVYSVGLSQFFEHNFTALGGQIVAQEVYSAGDTDFTAQLTTIGAADPDVIFMPGFTPEVRLAVAQARTIPQRNSSGITATFLGGDGWGFEDLLAQGGAGLNDSYFSDHFSSETQDAEAREFVKSYRAVFGIPPNGLAALGYDALKLVATAMRRANSTDPQAVRDAIAATRDYKGATSLLRYDENRHPQKSTVIMKIDGGRIRLHQQVEP